LNKLNVEYRKVEALIPYARNPRTHAESQIAKIAASIVEYGWTNPILVDGDNGIIAGHGRLAAARKLGLDQVPVIELAHLTVAQKRALVIADNRLALDAGWDEEMLALELAELSDVGYDLALTGFDDAEIEALLTGEVSDEDSVPASATEEPDAADDVPEAPVVAVSRTGDVWAIGPHRLICGDATDRDVVAALMQGEVSRLCFTSPPYGNQRDYTSGGISDWDGLMRGPRQRSHPVLGWLAVVDSQPRLAALCMVCLGSGAGDARRLAGPTGSEFRVRLPLQPRKPQAPQNRALQARRTGIASARRWLVHGNARQGR